MQDHRELTIVPGRCADGIVSHVCAQDWPVDKQEVPYAVFTHDEGEVKLRRLRILDRSFADAKLIRPRCGLSLTERCLDLKPPHCTCRVVDNEHVVALIYLWHRRVVAA